MSIPQRVARAWRNLQPDQRLAALAALLLLLSMLLPWYQETGFSTGADRHLARLADSKTAFQVYSFVEAAIFLVAIGTLVLMFARGERRAFHLPGGDGLVVMAGGLWVMFLIFYRQLDKPNGRHEGDFQTTIGVQWGIFIAFLLGALLAYAGWRIRAANIGEPPADHVAPRAPGPQSRPRPAARRRPDGAVPPPMDGQLSFDEAEQRTRPAPADEAPTSVAWEEPPTRRARRRDVFERPADPDEPSEFDPPTRRRRR
jgi:hypothetical protein